MEHLKKLTSERAKVRLSYIDERGYGDIVEGYINDAHTYGILFQQDGETQPVYIYHHRIVAIKKI